MLTNLKTAVLPAALAVGLFGANGSARADTWEHIDELALRLQHQAEELHEEAHAHFQQTPVYRQMDEVIDQMEKIAAHVHDLAHHAASIPHLSNDLRALERLQHQGEHLLAYLGRSGQVDPVAYRHLKDGFADVYETNRHLRRDLRALEHQMFQQPYPSTPYPGPAVTPQPGPVVAPTTANYPTYPVAPAVCPTERRIIIRYGYHPHP